MRAGETEWCRGGPKVITADAAGAFAAAVGERDPLLLSGRVVAPTMAIIPAWEAQEHALAQALPPEALSHALHAEHAFEFLAPLRPERPLTARSRLLTVSPKRRGVLVTILTEVWEESELVNRQHYAVFAVGAAPPSAGDGRSAPAPGVAAPAPARDGELAPVGSLVESVDEEWARRYADASGDFFEVHLSTPYAQALGYPSTILHGMCTFGIAARAVRELTSQSPAQPWLRLGVRFSAPVLMPARLRTDVSVSPADGGGATGTFVTRDPDRGSDVLTRGSFEFA
jgi:acyl dehydratase